MAEDVIIYHNPKCAKSRETLQLLRDHGVEPQVVKYLEDPPSPQRVLDFIDMLGIEPAQIVRSREKEYKKVGLSAQSSRNEVAHAIAAYPVLLERPIVVRAGKARLGRPPERVLEIL